MNRERPSGALAILFCRDLVSYIVESGFFESLLSPF